MKLSNIARELDSLADGAWETGFLILATLLAILAWPLAIAWKLYRKVTR
jgi:hypothetical protein